MNRLRVLKAIAVSMIVSPAHADWPNNVNAFQVEKNKIVQIAGSFEQGAKLSDLSWAWSSSNACFVSLQARKFAGNHVFFATRIPDHSIMTIKVIPSDSNQDVSLYAYMVGSSTFDLPPRLPRTITCEADYKWDRPWVGKTQDHTRSVQVNAISTPYNVLIGISGPESAIRGGFKLEVSVNSRL